MAVLFAFAIAAPAAAADLSAQKPIEIKVELGNPGGGLVFTPRKISFEAGKLYKLLLTNRSPHKHYFSALGFAGAIWTRKVETEGAEIKGAIREIELKPGGSAEWFFVPVKAGTFSLTCTIPGHAESGMTGVLVIR
jgi:uncharacterized cupredoxin-like copper-binding protein